MTCLVFSPVDSLSQSVKPNGQIGVPPCQVGFGKHSSCCLVWAPCVGAVGAAPLPRAREHKGTSNWQTRYGRSLLRPIVRGLRCSEKSQHQSGTKGKKNVLHHSPCSSGVWAGRLYASASASSAALITQQRMRRCWVRAKSHFWSGRQVRRSEQYLNRRAHVKINAHMPMNIFFGSGDAMRQEILVSPPLSSRVNSVNRTRFG